MNIDDFIKQNTPGETKEKKSTGLVSIDDFISQASSGVEAPVDETQQLVEEAKETVYGDELGFMHRGLEALQRPGRLAPSLVKSVVELDPEPFTTALEQVGPKSMAELLAAGKPGEEGAVPWEPVLKDLGVPEGPSAKIPTPTAISEKYAQAFDTDEFFKGRGKQGLLSMFPQQEVKEKTEEEIQKNLEDRFDLSARDAASFLLDVGTDPLTYLTAGVAPTAQAIGKGIGRTFLKTAGQKQIKEMAKEGAVEILEEASAKSLERLAKKLPGTDQMGDVLESVVTSPAGRDLAKQKAIKDIIQTETKLAGVADDLPFDEAIKRASLRRAERKLSKQIAEQHPDVADFVDYGGLKFGGRTIVKGEQFTKLGQTLRDNPAIGPVISGTEEVLGKMFKRDYFRDPKVTETIEEYRRINGLHTDDTLDGITDAMTIERVDDNGNVIKEVLSTEDREIMFETLARIEDESKELLANHLAAKETGLAQAKTARKIIAPLIKQAKNLNREIAKRDYNALMLQVKGVGGKAKEALEAAGITDIEKFAALTPKELGAILNKGAPVVAKKVGKKQADEWIRVAQSYLADSKVADDFVDAIENISGIGKKRAEFLEAAGINSMQEFANLTPAQVIQALQNTTGKNFARLTKDQQTLQNMIAQANDIVGQSRKELPMLTKQRDDIMNQIDDILDKIDDPDIGTDDVNKLLGELDALTERIKKSNIPDAEFEKIFTKHVNQMPEHLRGNTRKVREMLRKNEKYDKRAGLLTRSIPNYVPRKYQNLKWHHRGTSAGGDMPKTLGGRRLRRKIGNLDEARQYASDQGGQLIEDIAIPLAERMLRSAKARNYQKLESKLREMYSGKIPKEIKHYLEEIQRKPLVNDVYTNAALRKWDAVTDFYKANLTGVFPSFHFRNWVSNKFLATMGVGIEALNPITNMHGMNMKLGKNGYITDVYGRRFSYDEIKRMAKEHQVTKGFYVNDLTQSLPEMLEEAGAGVPLKQGADQIKGVIPFLKETGKQAKQMAKPLKRGRDVGQFIEETDRLTMFSAFIKKGLSPEDAAKQVNKFLFDYDNLSNWEKSIMKRIFPFYTFKRKSIGLFADQLVKNPKMFASVQDFVNFLSEEDMTPQDIAKLPQAYKNRLIIRTGPGPDDYVTGLDLGLEDGAVTFEAMADMLNGVVDQDPDQFIEGAGAIVSQINPLAKSVLELFANRYAFSGKSILKGAESVEDLPTEILGDPETGELTPLGEMLELYTKDKGVYEGGKKVGTRKVFASRAPYKLFFLRNIPTSRLQMTLGGMSKAGRSPKDENVLTRLLTGYTKRTIDPSSKAYFDEQDYKRQLYRRGVISWSESGGYYMTKEQKARAPQEVKDLLAPFWKKKKKKTNTMSVDDFIKSNTR